MRPRSTCRRATPAPALGKRRNIFRMTSWLPVSSSRSGGQSRRAPLGRQMNEIKSGVFPARQRGSAPRASGPTAAPCSSRQQPTCLIQHEELDLVGGQLARLNKVHHTPCPGETATTAGWERALAAPRRPAGCRPATGRARAAGGSSTPWRRVAYRTQATDDSRAVHTPTNSSRKAQLQCLPILQGATRPASPAHAPARHAAPWSSPPTHLACPPQCPPPPAAPAAAPSGWCPPPAARCAQQGRAGACGTATCCCASARPGPCGAGRGGPAAAGGMEHYEQMGPCPPWLTRAPAGRQGLRGRQGGLTQAGQAERYDAACAASVRDTSRRRQLAPTQRAQAQQRGCRSSARSADIQGPDRDAPCHTWRVRG